ncbi:MAG: hypothetical protein QGG90_01255 [Nitrospinota bacterium]|jgi:hypothetical protein|nr:hypothetical protein [Nitrospinota bacterium]
MKTLKEKELALLSIRNLNRYLHGEIKKEEWRENMRRIEDMLTRQQALPLFSEEMDDPRLAGSVSEN